MLTRMPALGRTILLALALAVAPAVAEELNDFTAALERMAAQYHFAMRALETSGREQTSAEVQLLRQEWQALFARYAASRGATPEDTDSLAATFTSVDTQLVGALIVIDIGSREAARAALAPIGETLNRLRERPEQR
jgi:hypothetical protein